jgi:hypothetical protein
MYNLSVVVKTSFLLHLGSAWRGSSRSAVCGIPTTSSANRPSSESRAAMPRMASSFNLCHGPRVTNADKAVYLTIADCRLKDLRSPQSR